MQHDNKLQKHPNHQETNPMNSNQDKENNSSSSDTIPEDVSITNDDNALDAPDDNTKSDSKENQDNDERKNDDNVKSDSKEHQDNDEKKNDVSQINEKRIQLISSMNTFSKMF